MINKQSNYENLTLFLIKGFTLVNEVNFLKVITLMIFQLKILNLFKEKLALNQSVLK